MSVELRSFVYLNKLQPQLAAYLARACRSDIPTAGVTSLGIELQPGIEINRVADVAMKQTAVKPSIQIEEREYGILELHHKEQEEVRFAGRAILEELDMEFGSRVEPEIQSNRIVNRISPYHAQGINQGFDGSLILEGESLFILEVQPALNIMFAANEAEKATGVKLVHVRYRGRFGRLYLAGSDDQTRAARDAVEATFEEFCRKKDFSL